MVFVQYIRSPGYFVVQREQDLDKIERMSLDINLKCVDKSPAADADTQLEPGQLLENGRLSDRYRIGTDTGRIVSNRIGYYRPILRASLQVHQLLMDRITHDDQRAFKRPVTRPPSTHACVLFYGP